MTYPISLEQQQKLAPSLKQMQRLMMSAQMQQALHLLQLPVLELSTAIEAELEQNPVLEVAAEEEGEEPDPKEDLTPSAEKALDFNDRDFEILQKLDEEYRDFFNETQSPRPKSQEEDKLQNFIESSISYHATLFEHLMQQARETYSSPEEFAMAEVLIGSLDENGFLVTPLSEISQLTGFKEEELQSVLKILQTFEPVGVGAENLQQALLIQLRTQGKKETLAYKILTNHYKDLLHNHIPQIQKGLKCTAKEIAQAVREDIAKLDLHPGVGYVSTPVQTIVPDITLHQEGEELSISVNEDSIPNFRLNRKYMRMLEDETLPPEAKEFIKNKILSAKWLVRNLSQRNQTLYKIAEALSKKQRDFFLTPEGKLEPLTMKALAEEIEVHESTVARAVANKYIDSPRGVLPLRSFFSNGYATAGGDTISARTVRDLIIELIRTENKNKPLSDEAIAKQIKAQGIDCARRTVAKYRSELNLGNAHQRREY